MHSHEVAELIHSCRERDTLAFSALRDLAQEQGFGLGSKGVVILRTSPHTWFSDAERNAAREVITQLLCEALAGNWPTFWRIYQKHPELTKYFHVDGFNLVSFPEQDPDEEYDEPPKTCWLRWCWEYGTLIYWPIAYTPDLTVPVACQQLGLQPPEGIPLT